MDLLKIFLQDKLHLDPEEYLEKFVLYENLLLGWNKKINLISRRSDSIEDHILNSIFFLSKYKFDNVKSLADIGTGGGFPGIPLKILFPELKLLLVDSIKKKVNVLNIIIDKMGFKDAEAVCGRAGNISNDSNYNMKFDCVISKAVSSLDNLYEWGNGFIKPGGQIICIKGGDINTELESLKKMKYNFETEVINFNLDQYNVEDKKLVIIKNCN
ncbi:MAG: 16S rRNA (guanine(527)-N(7))-methyltransferase RsmG [bacterium]